MPTSAMRTSLPQALANGEGCSNAGLALERYLAEPVGSDENRAKAALIHNVARMPVPELYKAAYARWENAIAKLPGGAKSDKFRVTDRLIIGLGAESVLETSITLNRIYGVPVIPGSALKGLARHYYEQRTGKAGRERDDLSKAIFGSGAKERRTDEVASPADSQRRRDAGKAGYITFLDAWYVPEPGAKPLRTDVITVHHPLYYQTAGKIPPTDFDDPTPVGFVSAVGTYLIVLQANFEEDEQGTRSMLLEQAFAILSQALADYGVGGKTSSGYGRLRSKSQAQEQGDSAPTQRHKSQLLRNIELMPNSQTKNNAHGFYEQWTRLPAGPEKLEVAVALHSKLSLNSVRGRWGGKPLAEVNDYISKARSPGKKNE